MPAADAIRKDELLPGRVDVMDIVHIHYQFPSDAEEIFTLSKSGSSSAVTVKEVQAARKTVAGYVRDQSGSPIVGAAVMVKGTNNGTVVNAQGVYSITAKEGDVLVFSCLGYQDVTKTVGSESRIDVTMMEGKRKRR